MIANHSPLPFSRIECDEIEDANGRLVADVYCGGDDPSMQKSNAEFIVLACNSHFDLVTIVDRLVALFEEMHIDTELLQDARATLKKAGVK